MHEGSIGTLASDESSGELVSAECRSVCPPPSHLVLENARDTTCAPRRFDTRRFMFMRSPGVVGC